MAVSASEPLMGETPVPANGDAPENGEVLNGEDQELIAEDILPDEPDDE